MSTVDWTKIKSMDDVLKLDENLLYDESDTMLPQDLLQLNPNLTEDEVEDAFFWKDYNRGKILITGEPGSGKGITAHMIAFKMKYYFGKTAIIDTRPRKTFGNYIPFSFDFLQEQIERLSLVEAGHGIQQTDGKWIAFEPQSDEDKQLNRNRVRGEVFMRNSVMLLDEYGNKYMPRLQPNIRIAQDLLKLDNFWRHLHLLQLGVGVSLNDFNRKAIDKSVWHAKCVKMSNKWKVNNDIDANDIVIRVYLNAVKWNPNTDELQTAGAIESLTINASQPRHCLPVIDCDCKDGSKCENTGKRNASWCEIYNTDNSQGWESSLSHRRKQ